MVTEEFDFFSKNALKSYNLEEKIRYQLSMLDTLDAYTRRHSENVASITCRLCENLKLDEGFTIYCTTCAYIHDIRKNFYTTINTSKTYKTYSRGIWNNENAYYYTDIICVWKTLN